MLTPAILLVPDENVFMLSTPPESFIAKEHTYGHILAAWKDVQTAAHESADSCVIDKRIVLALQKFIETKEIDPALQSFFGCSDLRPHQQSNVSSSIHILGENDRNLLEQHLPDEETARYMQRTHASAISASGGVVVLGEPTPAIQPAITQPQFRLSDIFDPANVKDNELFQFPEDDDSEEDGDPETQNDGTDATPDNASTFNHRDGRIVGQPSAQSESSVTRRQELSFDDLDAELDAVLGRYDTFWEASLSEKSRRKLWDSTDQSRREKDIWAVHDTVDVSDFASLVPEPVLDYPFDLDTFQKRAIVRLERDENVFVAAHTSAGKTVVAEYAIALALQHKTRVIYTSPIKTLSNQKFRDFTERFGDVGLITGDVSVNPEARVLIMTTEILRSMLYRGVDLIRDLEWVIFDEVHWASNAERGVVWEESIILLPETCGIVMLSATVPNALEFASWVGRTKHRRVYVISTTKRPVPLVHSIFVKSEMYTLFDSAKGAFLPLNYKAASEKNSVLSKSSNVKFGGGKQHAWVSFVNYLRKNQLDPAIIFFFSKRKCEEAADALPSVDLTLGAAEKNQIHSFYQRSISRLSVADQTVPQIARCRDILKRGIGVHHAGILPIVKEATEVLFQMGLVRVLFCTETFAVGVNAPARTVVFSAIRKWDGSINRVLEPGEYVQMAGRAGRRGKDTVGTVLLYIPPADFPSELQVKTLLSGAPRHMKSQFRLTYNMILNLMRVEELRVEDVMSRSFSEDAAGRDSTRWKNLVKSAQSQLKALEDRSGELDRYRLLHQHYGEFRALSQAIASSLSNFKASASPVLDVGRVIVFTRETFGFALAVIIRSSGGQRAKLGLRVGITTSGPGSSTTEPAKVCRVAILRGGPGCGRSKSPYLSPDSSAETSVTRYCVAGFVIELVEISAFEIACFSSLKFAVDERGLNPIRGDPRQELLLDTAEHLFGIADDKAYWKGLPSMPWDSTGIKDAAVAQIWTQKQFCLGEMFRMLEEVSSHARPRKGMGDIMRELDKEQTLRRKLNELQTAASDDSLHLMPDFRQRIEVLTTLGYIQGGSVLLKGRAMCEVNCCELVIVELCFENILQNLDSRCLAALLSALVYQGAADGDDENSSGIERLKALSEKLYEGAASMKRILLSIGGIQANSGLPVSPIDYCQTQANFGLVETTYAWAGGEPFKVVCEIAPSVAEGTIVRTIVRLSELLREVQNVGRVIGDPVIQDKAEEGINMIKRDVIFAASLYVT